MTDRDKIILQKIVDYASDALEYVAGSEFDSFMTDKKTVSACAFVIGQIGELASNVSEETRKTYCDVPWRSICGMRNQIVHDYDHVDMTVLWGTITKSLPELIQQLDNVLAQEEEPEQGIQML